MGETKQKIMNRYRIITEAWWTEVSSREGLIKKVNEAIDQGLGIIQITRL